MSTEMPHELGVGRTPTELLASAVERVEARFDGSSVPLAPDGAERARGYLRALRSALGLVIQGEDPEAVQKGLPSSSLFDPLMRALGEELTREPSDEESATSALAALRAWVALQGAGARPAAAEASPDDSEDLRDRMRGTDAFELLVEVAHDFRSPLTSILFLAEALRDGQSGPVTDVQRSQLGLVYSAAFGLAAMASDVVDLAARERALLEDDAEPFALSEVFANVERMVRPLVEEKGLELRIVFPERRKSRGHPHALSRVLLNLTTNALKFTDEGSVELGVQLLPHDRLQYYVEDTGRGISPEEQRRLFHPFRPRAGGERQGYYFSGSGVGLSIARRLLRAMDSELSLDSSDERGTRFSFTMPAYTRH